MIVCYELPAERVRRCFLPSLLVLGENDIALNYVSEHDALHREKSQDGFGKKFLFQLANQAVGCGKTRIALITHTSASEAKAILRTASVMNGSMELSLKDFLYYIDAIRSVALIPPTSSSVLTRIM